MRTWTTIDIPEYEQFSYWREVICEAFTTLSPDAKLRRSFDSTVVQRDLGGILISDSKSKAQRIVRGSREISRASTPKFFINFQVAGTCLIRQDSREVLMRPGDFYLVDTTRRYTQDYSDWHVICVGFPRHLLQPYLACPAKSTAVRLSVSDGGLGAIAGSLILSLQKYSEDVDVATAEMLATSVVNVVAVALGGTSEAKEGARAPLALGLLEAMMAHVKRNIADSRLSVSSVAEKFRISPRYVHKLFEKSAQSFAQLVLEERLQRVAAELSRRGSTTSISDIAYRAGFGDLSYFCRAFLKRFGMSARSYRAAAADSLNGGD